MGSTMQTTTSPAPRLAYVPDVELFAAGTRGGKEYSDDDLEDIQRNLRLYGHLIKPPVKIGHEAPEQQPLTMGLAAAEPNTGEPKLGTVDWNTAKLERVECPACDGKGKAEGQPCPECKGKGKLLVLKAGLKDVPPGIAGLIANRQYDRCSAEIYDEDARPEGLPGTGKVFRALALLGGDLPKVKTLADLPEPIYHSERGRRTAALLRSDVRSLGRGCFAIFSEVLPATRRRFSTYGGVTVPTKDEMLNQLGQLPDDKLAEVCHLAELPDEPQDVPPEKRPMMAERARRFAEKARKFAERFGDEATRKMFVSGDRSDGADLANLYDTGTQPPASKADPRNFSETSEVAKVSAHYDRFSEDFHNVGVTKSEMLSAYRSALQRRPGLTAGEHLFGHRQGR
jgi:hypothetical protein